MDLQDDEDSDSEAVLLPAGPPRHVAEHSFMGMDAIEVDSDDEVIVDRAIQTITVPRKDTHVQLTRLYVSHFLSKWGDRMWEFAIALLLIEIWQDSLLMAAIYGLTSTMAIVLLGSVVGHYVDTHARLSAVRWSVFLQNAAILVCMITTVSIISVGDTMSAGAYYFCIAVIMGTAATADVGALIGTLAVERDWVKVVTAGDSELLARTSAILRRIDLTCQLVAPLVVGLVMQFTGSATATGKTMGALLIGGWNLVAMVPEYLLLIRVYNSYPALQAPKQPTAVRAESSLLQTMFRQFITLARGWRVYFQQSCALAGVALALLYCTVLSFHTIMTAYLYYRGISESLLSVARGAGAITGVGATFIFPPLQRRLGLTRTGSLASILQLGCLVLAFVSPFMADTGQGDCSSVAPAEYDDCISGRNREIVMLSLGVVASRTGLWLFDLAVSQMLLERVPEGVVATVSGVQGAIQSIMDMLAFVLGVIFSDPADWAILVYTSFGFVALSAACYALFAARDKVQKGYQGLAQDLAMEPM
eukprot:m.163286 g.163286  ORF g.163286 m.163286 type:complete len:533 (+) comp9876_c0_seq8:24-1622(+)